MQRIQWPFVPVDRDDAAVGVAAVFAAGRLELSGGRVGEAAGLAGVALGKGRLPTMADKAAENAAMPFGAFSFRSSTARWCRFLTSSLTFA